MKCSAVILLRIVILPAAVYGEYNNTAPQGAIPLSVRKISLFARKIKQKQSVMLCFCFINHNQLQRSFP